MALSKSRIDSSTNDSIFLFKSCEQGDLQTIENHLENLSSHDICLIRDEQQATLAHHASRYGHLKILEYFIEIKHIDISQLRTEHGATCAHDAAVCDQVQILHYLLHYHQLNHFQINQSFEKLRWNERDQHGNTPLHLAASYGSIRCLRHLLEYESADGHIRSYNGFQPIHYASASGHSECVKLLLNSAPDTINEQTNTLLTPIYLACQNGSLETIQVLTSRGANFKLRDENGLNCLHAACQTSHIHVIQWLIEKQNLNVNDVDYMNNSPLHYAAATGNSSIISYLLDRNAQMTISSTGNSPLHVAAENGHSDICGILIERGHCSVKLLNSNNMNAADLADYYNYSSLAKQLRLYENNPLNSDKSSKTSENIRIENARIVRLVVKKRNVQRCDASNQVTEDEFLSNNEIYPTKSMQNQRFDLSELRAHVEKHEATRRDTRANSTDQDGNLLLHSQDSINQLTQKKRVKLPAQTYAPWLKFANMSPEAFQREIQNVGSKLRKVRRDSLLKTPERDSIQSERRSRQSQSVEPIVRTSNANENNSQSNSNNNNTQWKPTGYQARPDPMPISKSHQFIGTRTHERPEWQRALIDRRRLADNSIKSDS